MADDQVRKTLIIGSGPAGLTAAIYTARAGLNPIVLAGQDPGGMLTKTSEVENYPGFKKGIQGPDLMEQMMEQAKHCGAEIIWESAAKIEKGQPYTVTTDGGQTFKTHTVIFATGASPRWIGIEGEKTYQPPNGSGITSCAVCDGSFYKKMPVAVVGGGDSAMEEATYLSNICSSVTIIHRREGLRASQVMIDRARAKENIKWELNYVVVDTMGKKQGNQNILTGVKVKNTKDDSTKEIKVDGLFVAIGHIPATEVLKGVLELDDEGYIKVDERQRTSLSGFFAAGDCHDRRYRQAVTAAGMGCKAALEAERYLTEEGL